MTGAVSVIVACTAVADDNGMRALHDVFTVAADLDYRVIGGHMVRLLRHVYDVPGIPRVTSDADTGIDEQVAVAGDLHDQLTALGYTDTSGNRYELVGRRSISWYPPRPRRASDTSGNGPLTGRPDCAWRWRHRRSRSRSQRGSPTAPIWNSKSRFPTLRPRS